MDLAELPMMVPRLMALLGLLGLSAFFSGSETSLFSLTRVQREKMARSARAADRYAVKLVREPRRLIVTLLLGNELVNMTISSLSAGLVERLLPSAGELVLVAVSTATIVPIILVFGEITPKTVALRLAEGWARLVARPLGLFATLVTPLRILLTWVAAIILRIIGGAPPAPRQHAIGEAEFKELVDVGSEAGELEATERRLIHNVFAFGDRNVAEIMTPARLVFALSYDLPLLRLVSEVSRAGFSRIPIYRGRKEDVVGILYAKDLLGSSSGRLAGRTVKDLIRPALYVPKTTKCDRLFGEMQKKRTHFALVVDEYGRLVGLVTMEDLLVALFGPIRDEKKAARPVEPAVAPVEEAKS